MFYKQKSLEDIIEDMRNLGNILVPYNFPKAPLTWEYDLAILKQKEAIIDGYSLVLHYQKNDYDKHFVETLQIYNKNSPFLPFNLICKLGKRFLGANYLSLVELFRDSRKIYIWSVCLDHRGIPIPTPYKMETEECQFEGLNYSYVQPSQVNFY